MSSDSLNSHLAIDLSVIVAIVSDTTHRALDLSILRGCLESLEQQVDAPAMEIIVPYVDGSAYFDSFAQEFPRVIFLCIQELTSYNQQNMGREHHDELRARGILASHGRIVALIEDYARLDKDWSKNLLLAHEQEFAGIGGAIENQIDRPLSWAVYFCDFGKYQNPIQPGETTFASDANVSYKRDELMKIREYWQASFREPLVNARLLSLGRKLGLDPKMVLYQFRKDLRLKDALFERFLWGKSYALSRPEITGLPKRIVYILSTPIIPLILLFRIASNGFSKTSHRGALIRALPLILILLSSWALGEFSGYIAPAD